MRLYIFKVYKVCQKRNKPKITKNLSQIQTTNKFSPLVIIPLKFDALLPCPLHSLLKGYSLYSPQFSCHGSFDGFHIQKTGPLVDPLELAGGGWEKITQVRCVERQLQHQIFLKGDSFSSQQGHQEGSNDEAWQNPSRSAWWRRMEICQTQGGDNFKGEIFQFGFAPKFFSEFFSGTPPIIE